jgi:hypothetical protein
MLADRELITDRADAVARGVANGIMCYLQPGQAPTLAPEPTEAA